MALEDGVRVTRAANGNVTLTQDLPDDIITDKGLRIDERFLNVMGAGLETVVFIWTEDPEKFGRENIEVETKENGQKYFGRGFFRFLNRHKLKIDNTVSFTYIGNSTIEVMKHCREWISEDEEVQPPAPKNVVLVPSDDEMEEPVQEPVEEPVLQPVQEQNGSPVTPTPNLRGRKPRGSSTKSRGGGRKRKPTQIRPGFHFGYTYPDFCKPTNELGFAYGDATVLGGFEGQEDCEIRLDEGDKVWTVNLRNYYSQKRYVFCAGWKDVREELQLSAGDHISFKLLNADPLIFLFHVAKPPPA